MEKEKIFLIDDEPEYLDFLVDYIEGLGFELVMARTLPEALRLSGKHKYKLALIDMNIPVTEDTQEFLTEPVSRKYPGFCIAHHLRNIGYGSHQVIAYTVHDDELLNAELQRIRCRYVLKGRPFVLKSVLKKSLGIDA